MSWNCRIYRGLNRGVEVLLSEGRHVIGSDPFLADLVLVDEGIAPEHLVLLVAEEGITLLGWHDSVIPTQDGVELKAGAQLVANTRLEAGFLLWSFCDSSHILPDELGIITLAKATPFRRKGKALWWMGAFSLCLVAGIIALLGYGWWAGGREGDLAHSEQSLKHFLAAPAYSQVVLNSSDPTHWLLSGYIDENSSRLALQQFLDNNSIRYRFELRTMEDLRQGAEFILQKFGYEQLQIHNGKKPGWLRLSGESHKQDETWGRIESLLKREVPGLLGIENQVQQTGTYRQRLDALLQEFDLADSLRVHEGEGAQVVLMGSIDEAQRAQFQLLQQQFYREFGSDRTLVLRNHNQISRQNELEFEVRSVSLGRVSYVTLSNNQRYPVGGATVNGVRILSIARDAVIVSKGKQQYVVKLRGGKTNDD